MHRHGACEVMLVALPYLCERSHQIYGHTNPVLATQWVTETEGDFIVREMPFEVLCLGRTLTRWAPHVVAWLRSIVTKVPTEADKTIAKENQASRVRAGEPPASPSPLTAPCRPPRRDRVARDPTLKRRERHNAALWVSNLERLSWWRWQWRRAGSKKLEQVSRSLGRQPVARVVLQGMKVCSALLLVRWLQIAAVARSQIPWRVGD